MFAKQQRETTNRNPKNDSEVKQIFSEFRRKNRMNTEMEVAPIRTLDDFILTKSRFQVNWVQNLFKIAFLEYLLFSLERNSLFVCFFHSFMTSCNVEFMIRFACQYETLKPKHKICLYVCNLLRQNVLNLLVENSIWERSLSNRSWCFMWTQYKTGFWKSLLASSFTFFYL